MEVLAGQVDRAAVREMAAVGQAHAHDGIARLEHGEVHRRIRLRAGMRLHVDVLAAEKLLSAVTGEVFHHIHAFAAAVVAVRGIPFRVLVRQARTHRRHHRRGYEVL